MSTINHDYIETYIRDLIINDNSILQNLEEYAKINNIPIIHPEVRNLIKVFINSHKIEKVLEIGTAIGYSAISFCNARKNVKVDTIDRDENMIKIAKENIGKAKLVDRISIYEGDATEIIKNLDGLYDCIFLDGAKGHYVHMLEECIRLLKDGGLLISDNVLFRGMIATNSLVKRRKITIVKRMRRYLEVISNHPKLLTSIIPIGDGLAVSYKKEK